MKNAKLVKFEPRKKLDVVVPGSKSMTNRALIMAAMAQGTSRLSGVLNSDDSFHCLESLKRMGVDVKQVDDTTFTITSPGIAKLESREKLYIGSAGTTARFLPGLLAASASGTTYTLDASEQLRSRPLRSLLESFEQLGAEFIFHETPYCLPFSVTGNKIKGGKIHMAGNVSSQFISGMLMAAPYFEKGLVIEMITPIVQAQYVQITIDMMQEFGVEVEVDEAYTRFHVKPQAYQACDYEIEADVSTAGYFFAMGLLFDTEVSLHINKETVQPDIQLLTVLEKMGATVKWNGGVVSISNNGAIKGNQTFDLNPCSDQALTVGVVSAYADGPVELTGIGHIRHHESDRLKVLAENLAILGIRTELKKDSIIIYPGMIASGKSLPTHDDHRVAMAFALIGLKSGDLVIEDALCTKKTFPDYFQYLQTLGANITYEEV